MTRPDVQNQAARDWAALRPRRRRSALRDNVSGVTYEAMDRAQVEDIVARSAAETRADFNAMKGNVDTRLAEMTGELKVVSQAVQGLSALVQQQQSDSKTDSRATRTTIITTGLGLAALIATIVAAIPGYLGLSHEKKAATVAVIPEQPSVTPLVNAQTAQRLSSAQQTPKN